MSTPCPVCNAFVDERGTPAGAMMRCDACGARFKPPRARRGERAAPHEDDGGLGIHPALARRYQVRQHSDEGEALDDAAAPEPGPKFEEIPGDLDDELQSVQFSPSLLNEKDFRPEENPGIDDVVARAQEKRGNTRPIGDAKTTAGRAQAAAERPPAKKPEDLPAIPGYDVIATVGKGAMGRVYRAIRQRTKDVAAVKVLAPELAARPDFVARFEREAAALRAVDHPGVVSILENGSADNIHYLSMRFVEGRSLRRSLDGGPLAPSRAINFARQIVQGLAAAHSAGVIHRDLKPENILVQQLALEGGGTRERLVLVDFGLAGMAEETDPHPNLTKSRMTMGTVNYMAPEQRTDAKRVDARADIYASGVILYELLTGDLPLGRFKLPTERGLALPRSVDEVLARALDRERDRRPATAQEFDKFLAAVEADLAATASQDTVVGRDRDAPVVNPDAITSPSIGQPEDGEGKSLSQLLDEGAVQTELDSSPAFDSATTPGIPSQKPSKEPGKTSSSESPQEAADRSSLEMAVLGESEAKSLIDRQDDGDDGESDLVALHSEPGTEAPTRFAPADSGDAKRLAIILAVVAVFVGIVIGIWRASDSDEASQPVAGGDVDTSNSAQKEASANATAPNDAPQFLLTPPAWRADGETIYFDQRLSPEDGAPSLAVLDNADSGPGLAGKVTLNLTKAPAKKAKDGEVVTVSEGYGGLFFVDESRERVVGVAIVESGQVRFVEIGADGAVKPRMTSLSADPSAPVDVRLLCSTAQRSCKVRVGKGEVGPISSEVLGRGAWSLALGCRDVDCRFDGASAKR